MSGASVVFMTGGAPGTEWAGPGVLFRIPQCPGRPSEDDLALNVHGAEGENPVPTPWAL